MINFNKKARVIELEYGYDIQQAEDIIYAYNEKNKFATEC
jgi:hypothetical protein